MIWEPFILALVLGIIVSAGLYFAYLWPSVEPIDGEPEAASPAEPDAGGPDAAVEPADADAGPGAAVRPEAAEGAPP